MHRRLSGTPRRLLCGAVALALTGALAAPAAADRLTAGTFSVPRSGDAPGYQVRVDPAHLGVSVSRGGEPLLRTAPDAFTFGTAVATRVRSVSKQGATVVVEAGSTAGKTVTLRLTPHADRFDLSWSVAGEPAGDRATHFDLAASGHWYGGGETSEGTPQPYPLSAGVVNEPEFSPASYMMQEPYFYTSKSIGVYVRTAQPMKVALANGRADLTVTGSAEYASTVFVESSRRAVYDDYVGEVGKPEKSDATDAEYASPLWNSWAQYYRNIDQDKVVAWARDLKAANVAGHTVQLDDKWESNYGNLTFDAKTFPDPKKLVDDIHGMGQKFGLWTTFWINLDSANYGYARDHGYLLHAKANPAEPCTVTWWNGTAGIIDLGNPQARDWYTGNLRTLMADYGVDGFKFDTRFFDDSCATSNGLTPQDYQKLGADMTDRFDQQGAGIRTHWGNQRYGFVIRAVDADTTWDGLRTSLRRASAISADGYPFVETDMIGGSESMPPPSEEVLVRWAQAASLMPLMYASTSPVTTVDTTTGKPVTYPADTARLYADAVRTHAKLAGYLQTQVKQAVADGTPIMRPVFFDFPADHRFDTIDDEWLLGPALLAAPMITAGTSRDVVLPAGLWFDPNTHRVELGGRTLRGYPAPLGTTPMFVRLGAPGSAGLITALSR
ncbi:glycoside hydrolase family 31 protein [Amycolatopsis sp. WQ 127309]|uniref:glycoside hydrolase family 31 protein n=1 Tax=Amycolatopsis sp. WQ 127309 TaxID=2932773 RepID=UPI001FF1B83E|nr:glycoside hydrolase family 31 protein [Amycolatopsis sp. WQ 127309]UOZ03801.1 glycoside hydrolase family 31 protein [Amycolatopsis sp. WQ 127309]